MLKDLLFNNLLLFTDSSTSILISQTTWSNHEMHLIQQCIDLIKISHAEYNGLKIFILKHHFYDFFNTTPCWMDQLFKDLKIFLDYFHWKTVLEPRENNQNTSKLASELNKYNFIVNGNGHEFFKESRTQTIDYLEHWGGIPRNAWIKKYKPNIFYWNKFHFIDWNGTLDHTYDKYIEQFKYVNKDKKFIVNRSLDLFKEYDLLSTDFSENLFRDFFYQKVKSKKNIDAAYLNALWDTYWMFQNDAFNSKSNFIYDKTMTNYKSHVKLNRLQCLSLLVDYNFSIIDFYSAWSETLARSKHSTLRMVNNNIFYSCNDMWLELHSLFSNLNNALLFVHEATPILYPIKGKHIIELDMEQFYLYELVIKYEKNILYINNLNDLFVDLYNSTNLLIPIYTPDEISIIMNKKIMNLNKWWDYIIAQKYKAYYASRPKTTINFKVKI